MRAGKLDREIKIQTYAPNGVDSYGTPIETWTDFKTVRAQIVQASTEEFIRNSGETTETAMIFRTHFLDGVTTLHRVEYDGQYFNIVEVNEIGRRKGLELRCKLLGAS